MAAKKSSDTFANVAAISISESAANTQTSKKFTFPFSIMDKMALIIERLEYDFASLDQLNSSVDTLMGAVTTNATVLNLRDPADPMIIDMARIQRYDIGTAASGMFMQYPYVKDFTNLPGGGLLVAPNPLYVMIQGVGTAGINTMYFRMFYTYVELATDEYWQLVESRRVISS